MRNRVLIYLIIGVISYFVIYFILKGYVSKEEVKEQELVDKMTLMKNGMVTKYEIIYVDGCKYIVFYQKYLGKAIGVVHAGDCKNHDEEHRNMYELPKVLPGKE